jgi:hypothetical protein
MDALVRGVSRETHAGTPWVARTGALMCGSERIMTATVDSGTDD